MVNSTICNLSDSISTSFVDKLTVIKTAGEQLYKVPELSGDEILEIGDFFADNECKSLFFLSLQSKKCIGYAYKLCTKLICMMEVSGE